MATFDDVLGAARALTPADRVRLVAALWDEVPAAEWPLPSEEWVAEAQRRSEAFDAGQMSAAPWNEVRQRARNRAGLDG